MINYAGKLTELILINKTIKVCFFLNKTIKYHKQDFH